MEPLKEQHWRPTRQSGSKLRALQTLPRGSFAPSNIEVRHGPRPHDARSVWSARSLLPLCDENSKTFRRAIPSPRFKSTKGEMLPGREAGEFRSHFHAGHLFGQVRL